MGKGPADVDFLTHQADRGGGDSAERFTSFQVLLLSSTRLQQVKYKTFSGSDAVITHALMPHSNTATFMWISSWSYMGFPRFDFRSLLLIAINSAFPAAHVTTFTCRTAAFCLYRLSTRISMTYLWFKQAATVQRLLLCLQRLLFLIVDTFFFFLAQIIRKVYFQLGNQWANQSEMFGKHIIIIALRTDFC